MLDFEDEDDEWEVRREFNGMELTRSEDDREDGAEVQPGRRGPRRNRFIDEVLGIEERSRRRQLKSRLSTSNL